MTGSAKIDFKINGRTLPIRQFKLDWMVKHPSIAMIAKRGSGKSYACRDILKHFRDDIPGGIIISPTDKMNPFYGDFFPELYIHYKYSNEKIERFLGRQEAMKDKKKEYKKDKKKVRASAFILMDDCLASKGSWMKEEPILNLFFNGRHYDIMYILTMQFPLGITPELRNNFDYVFLFKESFVSNLKRIYDHYAGMFPNFNAFQSVFKQVTQDYRCMVIVNRGQCDEIFDQVFWFKASNEALTHKIGCSQFLKYHKHNYNPDKMRNKKFDISKCEGKRGKFNIPVDLGIKN